MLEKGLAGAMNARVAGSGSELVVLAHGFGADQSIWDKIVPCLTGRSRVVLFDWVFSGAVEDEELFDPVRHGSFGGFADDLIGLLEEMGLENEECVFVGHSLACMVGCIASVRRPELFKKLVLVGGSPRYMNTEDYEGGLKPSDIDNILSNIETNFDAWTAFFPTLVIDPADPSSVAKLQKSLRRMRPHIALQMAKTTFLCDERELLGKVATSCTIVQATNDMVVPMSVAEYLRRRITGKTALEVIECEGHFPQLTAHGRLVEVLEDAIGLRDAEEES
uniref:AB hydrolase-1 domain-containing protein n=1 Tax=Kalanchoe fedtschenkoi TaxID=63787 RepID=A0A7N0TAY1_KALFE